MAVMLTLTQCNGKEYISEEVSHADAFYTDIPCTEMLVHILLKFEYPNGQPVLLDSSKVFWVSQNQFLKQNIASWNDSRVYGCYLIVNDVMRKELENRQEIMHFTGYLNGEIVCERDVLVGADRCHVNYLGTEPLTQILHDIPENVQKSKFCELVNIEHIRCIIPSINAFFSTIDINLPYERKLKMIVDWFLSHDCITDARIDCVLCMPTYQGNPNNSRIQFSFLENGQTVNIIMLVTGNDPYFAGFVSE